MGAGDRSIRAPQVPGARLAAVARDLGLRPRTVKREAAALGLRTAWKPERRAEREARAASGGEPAETRRSRRPRRPAAPRRDWGALDAGLAATLRRTAGEILAEDPPVRVSQAELSRRTGKAMWFQRRKRQLPLSMAELAALREGLEHFRRRRIRSAARRLSERGETPTVLRVMRAAGLNHSLWPLAKAELERLRAALAAAPHR